MIKESVMLRSERGHFVVAADARPERRGAVLTALLLRKISVTLALGVRVTKVRCSGDGCSPIILQLLLRPAETKELRSGNQECPREPAPN